MKSAMGANIMKDGRRSVCFVGPLPPPLHGMSLVNADMVRRLSQKSKVHEFDVSNGNWSGLAGHAVKCARALRAVVGIIYARMCGARTFYGSVDDKFGGLYTAIFVTLARVCRLSVYLHYHSFYYVEKTTLPMKLVQAVAGPKARHVVLCACMARKFASRYGIRGEIAVVGNMVEQFGTNDRTREGDAGEVVLGLLSNLCFAKGLGEFVELVERARSEGASVRGILAGPAIENDAREYLDDALSRLGNALEWRGPVYAEEKSRFFDDIDIFVFPTKYPTEAYPLVLVEALANGRPVITRDRGCISELGKLSTCIVQSRDGNFVEDAWPRLKVYCDDFERLRGDQALASREGACLNKANIVARENLVDAIAANADIASSLP